MLCLGACCTTLASWLRNLASQMYPASCCMCSGRMAEDASLGGTHVAADAASCNEPDGFPYVIDSTAGVKLPAVRHRQASADLLGMSQVPTFLFYRGGRLVGRHVGSSRADLIGQILVQQNAAGVAPPPPPKAAARPRRKIMRSV